MTLPWASILLLLFLLPAPSLTLQQAHHQDDSVHKGALGLMLSTGSNKIIAIWNSVPDTEYNIAWECDDGTEDSDIVTATRSIFQYDIKLLPCTGCDVTVQAWDDGPQGESDTASARTKGMDPSRVQDVTASPDPCNPWLTVSWPEAEAGNCFILYTVSWRIDGTSTTLGKDTTSNTSLDLTTGLNHGINYEVCVVAQTEGDPTDETCSVAETPPPSGEALGLALSHNPYYITAYWISVADTDYNVTWVCDEGTRGSVIIKATSDRPSYEFEVEPCTGCNVTVQIWVDGPVCKPDTASARTNGVDPGPVETVSVTPKSYSCTPWLSVSWSPTEAGRCSMHYIVSWWEIGTDTILDATTSETTLNITTDLRLDARYSVCVSAKAEDAVSQERCQDAKTASDGELLSLTLTTGPSVILATWENSVPGVYSITWDCGETTDSHIVPETTNETVQYRIELPPCTRCNVTVEAGGDGPLCKSYTESSRAGTAVAEPVAEVNVISADCSAWLDVSWTPVKVGNCLVRYLVSWRVSGTDSVLENTSSLNTTLAINTGLDFGTNYSVCVAAEGEDGGPSNDTCSDASTSSSTGGPLDLVLSATPYEIVVCWATAPDTVSNITWHCDDTTGSNVTSESPGNNTVHYTIELLPCTTCDISVRQEGKLDTVSFSTKGVAPSPPTNLTTTPGKDSILVGWTEVKTPNCDITYYSVAWTQMNKTGNSSSACCSYKVTDLTPDIITTITIQAVSSVGYSGTVTIEDVIETKEDNNPPNDVQVGIIVGGVLAGLVVLGVVVAVFLKKNKPFSKARHSPSKTFSPTL